MPSKHSDRCQVRRLSREVPFARAARVSTMTQQDDSVPAGTPPTGALHPLLAAILNVFQNAWAPVKTKHPSLPIIIPNTKTSPSSRLSRTPRKEDPESRNSNSPVFLFRTVHQIQAVSLVQLSRGQLGSGGRLSHPGLRPRTFPNPAT